VTTLKPDTALELHEAVKMYKDQITSRALQGFVHSRSYSFIEEKFFYRDLSQLAGFELAKEYVKNQR
jgi:hypothetical protein